MRAADDIPHTEMLNQMRQPIRGNPRINNNYIESIKTLDHNDFQNDPTFLLTPIVVTSNKERHLINTIRSKHWANARKIQRIIWKYPLQGRLASIIPTNLHQYLYKTIQSINGCFVPGIPGYITENINPRIKISNGSPVILHSLTLNSRENYNNIIQRLEESQEDIILEFPPTHIHVKLPKANPNDFIVKSLIENEVIIPIPISERSTMHKVSFPGRTDQLEKKFKTHPIELGFAITVHKVQGQTCDRLILDLNKRPFRPNINFHGLYVALSGVKLGSNLRILPLHHNNNNLNYLQNLKPSEHLTEWLEAFNNNGYWSARSSN